MRLVTILNRVEKHKSFVYGSAWFEGQADGALLVVPVRSRWNSPPVSSGCGERDATYDRLEERRFEFVPLWGIAVFLTYRMRRVNCRRCVRNHRTLILNWFRAKGDVSAGAG